MLSRPDYEQMSVDVFLNTEKLLAARLAHTEEYHTFQSKWALGMAPAALLVEVELAPCQLLQARFELRKALRKVRCPIPSIPRCLFDIEYEDEHNRSHRIHRRDGDGCSKLELVLELVRGDDDALSGIVMEY